MQKRGEVTLFKVEVQGVLETIRWVLELNMFNVDIESDSFLTVNTFTSGLSNMREVGNMIDEGRNLLVEHKDISLHYVKKQANKIFHLLARVSCQVDCFNKLYSHPCLVLENLMHDAFLI